MRGLRVVVAGIVSAIVCATTSSFAQDGAQQRLNPESFLPPAPPWQGASEALVAQISDPWITPSEKTGLTGTPTYDETMAFVRKMDAASPLLRVEPFGTTPQGRPLLVVIASKDGPKLNPAKPVVLAQAGIHAGEIDGKDAGLMLLRDIAFHGKAGLLDQVNFLFVPIFNADGHERFSPYARPNQRGPVQQGWRHTAQNLNLNRDYVKADAPEMRAMLGLIHRYDPALYIDLHVTDGLDYQYDITFGFDGWGGKYADSPAIGAWMDKVYRPALDAGLEAAGHIPGPMFFSRDNDDITKGMTLTPFTPRYSHAWGDLARIPTLLVENHSLKPYKQRVLGTYVLLETTLKTVAKDRASLKAAITQDRALRPATVDANWKMVGKPDGTWPFRTMQSDTYVSSATGKPVVRWTGVKGPTVDVPMYWGEPGLKLDIAPAYWVPATKTDVIARLKAQGVKMETITAPRTVEVDMIRLTGTRVGTPAEGRVPIAATGVTHETRKEVFPRGSVRISTDQPLGALIAVMLEPQSDDSLFAWGLFPEILQRVEYMEPYAIAPMGEQMLKDPKIKAEFEAKLAADPVFAASPGQRLQWFYQRSPFYDARYLLYPIGREIKH